MDLATIIGLVLTWGAFLGSILIEGGELSALVNPSAALLVFGGTLGASMVCFPLSTVTGLPNIVKKAFMSKKEDFGQIIKTLVGYAEKARREGLLALEEEAHLVEDPFLKKGIQLAIDGTDPELVREILQTDIAFLGARHHEGANLFGTMGGFAPTLGVIGTVSGLVHMLANLSDPGSMGPSIAAAFIATLYGVCSANLLFLPLSNKLKAVSHEEVLGREIMMEGILAIQAGDNPRIVEEKLKAFLSPKIRRVIEAEAALAA